MAEVAIVAIIGCLIALLGIFTPDEMPLGLRMAYWITGSIVAWGLMKGLAQAGSAAAKLIGLPEVWGYAVAIPLGSALISWSVLWWLGGASEALGANFARIWPSTILVGLGFFGVFYVIYARVDFATENTQEAAEDTPQHTKLHERLPAGFPAIIALSVEDHYTRVHAQERSEMVLMPLSEAITLMPEGQGQQVHRSWWAARGAVISHKREGRDIKLILENDLEVPVSRAQVKPLRDEGWLS